MHFGNHCVKSVSYWNGWYKLLYHLVYIILPLLHFLWKTKQKLAAREARMKNHPMKRMLKGKETSMTFFHIFSLFSQVAFAAVWWRCSSKDLFNFWAKLANFLSSGAVLTTIKPKLAVDSSPQKTNIYKKLSLQKYHWTHGLYFYSCPFLFWLLDIFN